MVYMSCKYGLHPLFKMMAQISIYNIMIYAVIGGLFSENVWDSLATLGK